MSEALLKIKPLDDRVVVEALSDIDTTHSGIIIPDSASKERPQKGRVLAVGPGKSSKSGARLPMQVKVGDTVLFSKYGPDEIKVSGSEYLILSESSILAVIES